jgi:hypothetical protein
MSRRHVLFRVAQACAALNVRDSLGSNYRSHKMLRQSKAAGARTAHL